LIGQVGDRRLELVEVGLELQDPVAGLGVGLLVLHRLGLGDAQLAPDQAVGVGRVRRAVGRAGRDRVGDDRHLLAGQPFLDEGVLRQRDRGARRGSGRRGGDGRRGGGRLRRGWGGGGGV